MIINGEAADKSEVAPTITIQSQNDSEIYRQIKSNSQSSSSSSSSGMSEKSEDMDDIFARLQRVTVEEQKEDVIEGNIKLNIHNKMKQGASLLTKRRSPRPENRFSMLAETLNPILRIEDEYAYQKMQHPLENMNKQKALFLVRQIQPDKDDSALEKCLQLQ